MRLLTLAAVCAAAALAAGEGSAITAPKVIRVLEVSRADVDLDSGGARKAGDRFYFANALYSWAGTKRGKRIGRDEGLCTFTAVRNEQGWARAFCTAQFFLPGGSVTAQAFLRFTEAPQRFTVPVTGGTGLYAGVRGSIAIHDTGGAEWSNSALVFHLKP